MRMNVIIKHQINVRFAQANYNLQTWIIDIQFRFSRRFDVAVADMLKIILKFQKEYLFSLRLTHILVFYCVITDYYENLRDL